MVINFWIYLFKQLFYILILYEQNLWNNKIYSTLQAMLEMLHFFFVFFKIATICCPFDFYSFKFYHELTTHMCYHFLLLENNTYVQFIRHFQRCKIRKQILIKIRLCFPSLWGIGHKVVMFIFILVNEFQLQII